MAPTPRGAFTAEVSLTFLLVFVILAVTRETKNAAIVGTVIGFALMLVHLIGIPIDGMSVNRARSIEPALFVGGLALRQPWVFIVAPLLGGIAAALIYRYLYPPEEQPGPAVRLHERHLIDVRAWSPRGRQGSRVVTEESVRRRRRYPRSPRGDREQWVSAASAGFALPYLPDAEAPARGRPSDCRGVSSSRGSTEMTVLDRLWPSRAMPLS